MKIEKLYIGITITSFIIGLISFAYFNNLIVLNFPKESFQNLTTTLNAPYKKQVNLFFWYQDKWHSEKIELLWHNQAHSLTNLIQAWLNFIDEEQMLQKKITLQSVMIAPFGNTLFVSFDRSPFTKQQSTFEKLMFLESLLKTIRENTQLINTVQFLVRHESINDDHIDLSNPWPITGFVMY